MQIDINTEKIGYWIERHLRLLIFLGVVFGVAWCDLHLLSLARKSSDPAFEAGWCVVNMLCLAGALPFLYDWWKRGK